MIIEMPKKKKKKKTQGISIHFIFSKELLPVLTEFRTSSYRVSEIDIFYKSYIEENSKTLNSPLYTGIIDKESN